MKKFILRLIDNYQATTKNNKKRCRFVPSCSQYAKDCYMNFSFLKASFLTVFRIVRCNPFSKGGYDPIPLTLKEKKEIKQSMPKKITNDKINPFNMYYKKRYANYKKK